MPTIEPRDSNRGVVSQSEARTISLARPVMETRSTPLLSSETQRYLAGVREPIAPRSTLRGIADYVTPTPNEPIINVPNNISLGASLANLFGGSTSGQGGFGGRNYDNPITVVPGGVEGTSNSNTGLILLVVALGGGAAYWYYKKGGF